RGEVLRVAHVDERVVERPREDVRDVGGGARERQGEQRESLHAGSRTPAMRSTVRHSSAVTGWTESRAPRRNTIISESFGSARSASRVTGGSNVVPYSMSTVYHVGFSGSLFGS